MIKNNYFQTKQAQKSDVPEFVPGLKGGYAKNVGVAKVQTGGKP
jgi:hypothetical protein